MPLLLLLVWLLLLALALLLLGAPLPAAFVPRALWLLLQQAHSHECWCQGGL
jgi:hypothetical protein